MNWFKRKFYEAVLDAFSFDRGQFVRNWSNGNRSLDGRHIDAKQSLNTVSVLRCATLIAGAAASLPIDVFRKTSKGRENQDGHPIETLLNREPNPEMDAMSFRSTMWMFWLLWGNADAFRLMEGDRLIALWPLRPEHLTIERRSETRELIWKYRSNGSAEEKTYTQDEILHVPFFSLDGVVGMSVISLARNAIARAQAMEETGLSTLAKGARPTLVFKHKAKLSDKAFKNLQDSYEVLYQGPANAGRPIIAEEGMDVAGFSIPAKDSQFLEQEQYTDERIAMLFGLPPHMLGLTTKQTSWGTGIESQKQSFLDFTLSAYLSFFESGLNKYLLTEKEKRAGFYIKHNLKAFLRADIKTRYAAYVLAVQNRILNANEVRALEDLDPYEGGEVYTSQQQNVPVDLLGSHLQPQPNGATGEE